jgi:hypothetical protein
VCASVSDRCGAHRADPSEQPKRAGQRHACKYAWAIERKNATADSRSFSVDAARLAFVMAEMLWPAALGTPSLELPDESRETAVGD